MVILALVLALLSADDFSLVWTDAGKAFSVQFDSRIWQYTENADSFSLTHNSLDGLEIKITDRVTDPADSTLSAIAQQTFNRSGERQAAAIANEHELTSTELKSLNAAEGYYCEGVYGPDVEPISVRVLVLKRSGRILIAEGLFPGTEKQNSYSWRKCSEALNTVWQTISGVGKIKK
jgi:hypothetical protein